MGWDLTGAKVSGRYMKSFPFTGTVISSRVKYGGKVQCQVELDSPIEVFGAVRHTILVDSDEVTVAQ